jgi:hypothetical protein
MRRGLSILLALLFGVGPLSVLLPGGDEATLPACCRRLGAHHCAMAAQMAAMVARAEAGKASISAPSTCPNYPGPTIALLTPAAHAMIADAAEPPTFETAARARQSIDWPELSGSGLSHAGRGPPVCS